MADIVKREDAQLAPETVEIVSTVVRDMLAPVMESIGKTLANNTQAMEQIAAAQQITSERIAMLEKRVRLQTPMSKAQEKCINAAIRARARELLDVRGYADDRKAVTKLCGIIRRSVLSRYGVGSLREAPGYDYETALKQVAIFNDRIALRDVAREARSREEKAVAMAEQPEDLDGRAADAPGRRQPGEPDVHDPLEGSGQWIG